MPELNSGLNKAELSALHTETITALQAAAGQSRTLANISRRAASLFADGYQVRSYGEVEGNNPATGNGFYVVESPKGDKYRVWHGVKVGYECSCPCFADWNTCKHLEAIELMKKEAAEAEAADRGAELEEEYSWYRAELASRY